MRKLLNLRILTILSIIFVMTAVIIALFINTNLISASAYTENNFPVKLDGESVNIQGYNIDGNTYFKLRDISNEIGALRLIFSII